MTRKRKTDARKPRNLKELDRIRMEKPINLAKDVGGVSAHKVSKQSLKGNTDPNVEAGQW